MSIESFSGTPISTTYQRLVQTDGTFFADGTGSLLSITADSSSVAISASYALTASYLENAIPPFPYTGSAIITGSLNIIGPFTASSSLITGNVVVLGTASINTLIVNQRQLSTGSNQLGDAADDTQTLFGSVIIPTGSLSVTGSTFLSGPIFVEDIKPTSNIISIGNAGTDYLFLGVKNPNNLYPFSQYSPFPGIGIYSLDSFVSSTRGSVVVSYNSGSSVGNFQVWSVDDDGNRTERLVLSNDGNLGIGTNSPTSKLDVQGAGTFTGAVDADEIRVKGTIFARNVNDIYYLADGAIESFNAAQYTKIKAGGQSVIYATPGAVGIGTENPLFALDVNGTGRFTDNLTVTGSLNISGSVTSSQNIQVNGIAFGRGSTPSGTNWNISIGNGNFAAGAEIYNRRNIAIGHNTLSNTITSFDNIAIGIGVLNANTGDSNVGIGTDVLLANTFGSYNTSIGYQSMQNNTEGETNVSIGWQALLNNINGNSNTGVGNAALQGNKFGRRNTAVGDGALGILSQATSSNNTALGYGAGTFIYSGSYNTIMGSDSSPFETGSNNTVIGGRLSSTSITGSKILNNSVILADGSGSIRLYSPASTNILIGTTVDTGQKLQVSGSAKITNGLIVTGSLNVSGSVTSSQNIQVSDLFFGSNNTQGKNIIIGQIGTNSLIGVTAGAGNIALGRFVATGLISGDSNVFIGDDAGQGAINSDGNVIIGRAAGQQNLSNTTRSNYGNVFIGDAAARDSMDTDENVAVGAGALASARGIFSRGNTTVGTYTLDTVISSSYNVAVGYESGRDVRSGSFNILIGNQQKGFRTGSFNTVIGSYISSDTFTGNVTKSVVLADGSGSIRLYSPASTNILIGTLTDTGEKLQVFGSAKITNGLTVTGSAIISGSNATQLLVGTNSLFVSSSGNIGIGTTSPNSQLDVHTLQGGSRISTTHGTGGSYPKASGISFGATSTSLTVSNNGGTTVFTGGAGIYAKNNASSNNPTDLLFWTTANGSPADRMIITTGGSIGIGNTNPNVALDVSGVVAIRGGEAASEARMHFRASDNSNRFTIETDLDPSPLVDLLSFRGNNTSNILVLKGNGDIGMGTSTPTKNLTINRANASLEIRATNEFESAALFFGNPFVNSTAAPPKAAIIAAGLNTWSRSNLHFCLDDTTTNTEASLSNSRMILTKEGNLAVGIGNTSPISRFQVRGAGTTSATTTFLLQNSTPTTLTSVLDNGQTLFTGPSSTLANGVAQFNISQSLIQTAVTNSVIDAVRISPTLQTTAINQVQTALKVQATFTGSFTGSQNVIADFGATSVGSQLTVTDITSGSIYMVNDVSGLPIIEATSDWSVRMYNFPQTVFEKTGSNVNIYGTLNATGSFILPLSQSTTPAVGSAYWSGSLLFVYDGTRYRSSSFA